MPEEGAATHVFEAVLHVRPASQGFMVFVVLQFDEAGSPWQIPDLQDLVIRQSASNSEREKTRYLNEKGTPD